MTERKAIERLQRIRQFYLDTIKDDTAVEAVDMAIKAVEKQEKDRWIPVSERLPEDEYVLISKKPTKLSGSKWSVGIGIRMADPRSGKIQWRDSGFGVIQDDKVLAWRPLPEPYMEEES
jgi:hypothetical protein